MEAWTFINKETKEIIRFNQKETGDDFGEEYYFSDYNGYPIWVTEKYSDIEYLLKHNNHPFYNSVHGTPRKLPNLLEDYVVHKIEI